MQRSSPLRLLLESRYIAFCCILYHNFLAECHSKHHSKKQKIRLHVISDFITWAIKAHGSCSLSTNKPPPWSGEGAHLDRWSVPL